MRLDELMRKFRMHGENAAVERVLNVARLGKRRAEMISRNHKVEAHKRTEKEEIAGHFTHLAGNSGCVLRLAGSPQTVAGLSKSASAGPQVAKPPARDKWLLRVLCVSAVSLGATE